MSYFAEKQPFNFKYVIKHISIITFTSYISYVNHKIDN